MNPPGYKSINDKNRWPCSEEICDYILDKSLTVRIALLIKYPRVKKAFIDSCLAVHGQESDWATSGLRLGTIYSETLIYNIILMDAKIQSTREEIYTTRHRFNNLHQVTILFNNMST